MKLNYSSVIKSVWIAFDQLISWIMFAVPDSQTIPSDKLICFWVGVVLLERSLYSQVQQLLSDFLSKIIFYILFIYLMRKFEGA